MTSAVNAWFPARFPWVDLRAAMKNKTMDLSNVVVEGCLLWLARYGIQGRLTDFLAPEAMMTGPAGTKIPLPRIDDVFDGSILKRLAEADKDRYDFVYLNITNLAAWVINNGPRTQSYSAPVKHYNKMHEARMAKMFPEKRQTSPHKMKFADTQSQSEQHKIYFPVNFPWAEWKAALLARKISHSKACIQGVYMWLEANAPQGDMTDFIGGKEKQSSLRKQLPCIDEMVRPQTMLQLAAEDFDRYVIVRENMIWLSHWLKENLPKPSTGSERKYHELTIAVGPDNKQSTFDKWAYITCESCHKVMFSGPIGSDKELEAAVDEATTHIGKHDRTALSDAEVEQFRTAQSRTAAGKR